MSTRTIYELVPSKAELFEMVVADRSSKFMLAVDESSLDDLAPLEALTQILIAYGILALSREAIAFTRLVIAEGNRFPEIAEAFHAKALEKINRVMETWLTRQMHHRNLVLTNPGSASEVLRAMMIMEPQRAALLGRSAVPSVEEIAKRAEACARLFLNGCQISGRDAA